jgi:tRNA G10  N-methylase Trm11
MYAAIVEGAMATSRLPFTELPWFVLDGRLVEFPEGLKTSDYTHTLHRFPGKFVPQVARELLNLLGLQAGQDIVLDPFCGSGTLLIEAAAAGINSIGFDIDSLAAFITEAKITPLTPRQLGELRAFWRDPFSSGTAPAPLPDVVNLSHWFTPTCAKQLAVLKGRALAIDDMHQRNFSLAILSSIVRRVSNADDQTQKTYVSGTLKKTPPLPEELFPAFMSRAIEGMSDYSRVCRQVPVIQHADARDFTVNNEISAVATSPPYIDSIDYVYNQMLEYFWLYDILGIESVDEIKKLRKQPMGFRKASVNEGLERIQMKSPSAASILNPLVEQIEAVNHSEALNVVGYFQDFSDHLQAVSNVLGPGGKYALVVGESFIRGVTVPTPEILVSQFESFGFRMLGRCSYLIKRHYMKFPRRENSRTIKIDHVLCFEKL